MALFSKYNYLFKEATHYFLYNSISNSFAELDEETYNILEKQSNKKEINIYDNKLLEQLKKIHAIVENDEDALLRLKYFSMFRRMDTHKLSLTINPTLDCNFACPYCFEGHHPNIYMTDDVEDDIIKFIKKHKDATSISITWFGGEPLLAFGRIETLTEKLLNLGLKYDAGMITNGYLLDEHVISRLEALKIKSIQVTIDGLAHVHDKRRCLKGGKPTFDTIIKNIKSVHSTCPDINLNVRVNIDKTNADDFIELYKMFLQDEMKGIRLSPAFVDDIKETNKCVLNSKEQYDYGVKLFKEHNIVFNTFYPKVHMECFVRNRNFVSIGPRGELYKCWNDIGNPDKIYGYLDGRITNEQVLLRYLAASDPFDDDKCKDCLLLPVCFGGCPYQRIKRDYEKKDLDICPSMKEYLKANLLMHNKIKDSEPK